ncbi:phytase [Clostridium psychrophilum]|nr:phytase [Clostridium psychrophilum]
MYCCPYFYNYNMIRSFNKRIYSREVDDKFTQDQIESLNENNVNLVLDSQNYYDIPKNFRKSTDILTAKNTENLNLTGLSTLNISGSQQFSEYNLPLVINSIETSLPITVVDLRQESHGFINGYPVSWANAKNSANIGLTRDQVIIDEYNKLNNIKLNVPMNFYNHKNITIIPIKVENEYHLVNSKLLSYERITVTDGKIPLDDMVDYFVRLVIAQPKNTWLHFHCKQGIGRTTTFMIMYDMIKNSKDVTSDDIIKRQLLLANFDESHIKSFNNNERITFLESFYKYCKENINGKY